MRIRVSIDRVAGRLANEGGFGLIELLMAMLILNIGLLAVVASFTSGTVALRRAGKTTTGAVIADQQMELYRALTYAEIALDASTVAATSGYYSSDSAWSASQVTKTCTTPLTPQCNPSQNVTGADGDGYRVDTYIVSTTPTGGRPVKKVTVVIRDRDKIGVGTGGPAVVARLASTFDQSTGQG